LFLPDALYTIRSCSCSDPAYDPILMGHVFFLADALTPYDPILLLGPLLMGC
jgi:hypothetical protein